MNSYNHIKLIEAWQDAKYIDVAHEVEKMNKVDFMNFLILFMKSNGQKEIEILKKFLS